MSKLAVLAILLCSGVAAARPAMFTIENVDQSTSTPHETVTLEADGVWRYETSDAIGTHVTRTGTLAADLAKQLRAEIEKAKWTKLTPPGAHCGAITKGYATYAVNGTEVHRERGCASDRLDKDSAQVLDDVTRALAIAWDVPLTCGFQTCGPAELCIESSGVGGMPRPDTTPQVSYACSAAAKLPMNGGAMACQPPHGRRQTCVSRAP